MSAAKLRTGLAVVMGCCTVPVVGALGDVGAGAHARAVAARAPAHILVYAQEWSLWASRGSLPSGTVGVQLWNRGQDAHDLRIQRLSPGGRLTGRPQSMPVTQSGALGTARWRLRPGRYVLYCSLPHHRARGMHVTVRVH